MIPLTYKGSLCSYMLERKTHVNVSHYAKSQHIKCLIKILRFTFFKVMLNLEIDFIHLIFGKNINTFLAKGFRYVT